jgi:hypothetical protein
MFKPFIFGILMVTYFVPHMTGTVSSNDSPVNKNDSVKYIMQVRDFINHARIETLEDTLNILIDIPIMFDSSDADCLNEINNDTIHFSKDNLKFIHDEAKKVKIKAWPADISPRIKVMSNDTINRILSKRQMDWEYFHKNLGRSLNIFSLPIFFGNKYCLFYSRTACGGTCGFGSWRLYRKNGEFWFVVKSFCEWIS